MQNGLFIWMQIVYNIVLLINKYVIGIDKFFKLENRCNIIIICAKKDKNVEYLPIRRNVF